MGTGTKRAVRIAEKLDQGDGQDLTPASRWPEGGVRKKSNLVKAEWRAPSVWGHFKNVKNTDS